MRDRDVDEIVREQMPRLQSYVKGRVGNRDDADDIVQDTLYQFLCTISALDNPILHVSSWLYTVAHNLIINHGKKRREEPADDGDDFMHDITEILATDGNESPDMQMLRSMVWDELHKALDELPKEQRDALVMTEIEGMTVRAAADRVGVPQNTFLSRKHYAVKHIRKRLRSLYEMLITP